MNKKCLFPGLLILLLAGCAGYQNERAEPDQNFLFYSYPFTEKAAADALASARKVCLQRRQVPIQTSKACTLEKCTTYFQCVDQASAVKDGS